MGACPCPQCTIPKDSIRGIGTERDAELRKESKREDNHTTREKIEKARNFIYKEGYAVNSDRVETQLKPESLVPTKV